MWQSAEEKKASTKTETLHYLQMKINTFIHVTSYQANTGLWY